MALQRRYGASSRGAGVWDQPSSAAAPTSVLLTRDHGFVARAKLLLGGTALGVRVARSLYGRWRLLPEPHRERIARLAEHAKEQALTVRGEPDLERAAADLRAANETLAAALVETAEADPERSAEEVAELREDLRRELARLASAEINASRTPREAPSQPE